MGREARQKREGEDGYKMKPGLGWDDQHACQHEGQEFEFPSSQHAKRSLSKSVTQLLCLKIPMNKLSRTRTVLGARIRQGLPQSKEYPTEKTRDTVNVILANTYATQNFMELETHRCRLLKPHQHRITLGTTVVQGRMQFARAPWPSAGLAAS